MVMQGKLPRAATDTIDHDFIYFFLVGLLKRAKKKKVLFKCDSFVYETRERLSN